MTRKHLYLYLLKEERSLQANATAWQHLHARFPEAAIRPLIEALEAACRRASECRRALQAFILSDGEGE